MEKVAILLVNIFRFGAGFDSLERHIRVSSCVFREHRFKLRKRIHFTLLLDHLMDFGDYEGHLYRLWSSVQIERTSRYTLFTFGETELPYYLILSPRNDRARW